MGVRWLLLLAVILATLGAIQCPATPKHRRNPFTSFTNAVTRTFSWSRNGSSNRRSRGGAGDNSGSDSDKEQTASGNNPGGRLPRSRSSSPPAVGGGGASGSSSSRGSASNRMDGFLPTNRITARCREINDLGDAHIITNIQVSVFANIIREMRRIEANDECRTSTGKGGHQGSINCQETYVEFKKIPRQYRGECSEAISAQCCLWPSRNPRDEERKCSYFIQTGHRSATRLDGYFISLADCIKGVKDQLFMDHQLSSMGINPPEDPPQPLLPSNYSPEY